MYYKTSIWQDTCVSDEISATDMMTLFCHSTYKLSLYQQAEILEL